MSHSHANRGWGVRVMAEGFAQTKRGFHERLLLRLATSTALASTAIFGAASAQAGSPVAVPANMLPQGGHFVAGSGSIGTQGLTETITQSSQRGIIDFNSFSIGKSGTVKINNGAGATLDRVTGGGSLSQIMGTLSATGSVYLRRARRRHRLEAATASRKAQAPSRRGSDSGRRRHLLAQRRKRVGTLAPSMARAIGYTDERRAPSRSATSGQQLRVRRTANGATIVQAISTHQSAPARSR